MSQFTLVWDNSDILGNANVTGQRASYHARSSPTWLTDGFTPANDLPVTAGPSPGVDTKNTLLANVVYLFKVEAICTVGGLVPNDNGIPEAIQFACIVPTLTPTQTTCAISIPVTGTDISAARLTLIRSDTSAVILNKFRVNRGTGASTITYTQSGLVAGTAYYWQIELYATIYVNGSPIEVISSSPSYLNSLCSPYPFSTIAIPVCDSVTGLSVSAKVV